jgi:hypothetical protein
MRTTKNLTVSLPPEQLRDMQRTAKRENRTMSELVRETWRRYRQPQVILNVRDYVRSISPTPPALRAMQEEAKRKGTDKLTMAQIDREVAAVRRQEAAKRKSKQPKR